MQVELLSPARDADIGRLAISHGADAVYIGAPRFSARQAAGNSVADIESLCAYAHRYGARVLTALNTILTDQELEQARRVAWQLYEAGVDALIIQDMGLLRVDMPPIRLHASTQCDNRTAQHVLRLEQAGFSRVVLARELSLDEISDIRRQTRIELEAFVHGALCVSYSGRCYISQALAGRSANRGCCAQMCRLPYDLEDADGRTLVSRKHLLSLKDMDRSDHLEELIRAGITSLKIEGRLKDADYVRNIVAHYRRRLDRIIRDHADLEPASWGTTRFFFTPDPAKTFHRSHTDYMLHGRTAPLSTPDTPKSTGEPIGTVSAADSRSITISLSSPATLHSGDGLTFGNQGAWVNRVEGNRVYPARMPDISVGTAVSRNHDREFFRQLSRPTAERLLPVRLTLADTQDGLCLHMEEPRSGRAATAAIRTERTPARDAGRATATTLAQLGKLGGTGYCAERIDLLTSQPWFVPASVLNDLRRRAVEALDALPAPRRIMSEVVRREQDFSLPPHADYSANISNSAARRFYADHGAASAEPAFELSPKPGVPLMTCRFCIRYEHGLCPRQHPRQTPPLPLFLRNGSTRLRLSFDCRTCQMTVSQA